MVGMLPELANKIVLWPRLASFQGPSKHMQTNAVLTFISKPLGDAEGRDHRKPLLVEVWKAMHSGVPDTGGGGTSTTLPVRKVKEEGARRP